MQIRIQNKAGYDQEFEVHGWNNNKTITVKAHSTAAINAPDGTSGAIIALHEGHEGEQAEITKKGFGGNDFIDLSNIVGAGGNLTVQQVGDASTRKGDPSFMIHLNEYWHKADQGTRDSLKHSVFLDNSGNVKRIGPIKGDPNLENFVRKFADGKTYIGEGSWNGSPGNANDNNQSSAAHGNKDILIVYNDRFAAALPDGEPHLVHALQQKRIQQKSVVHNQDGPGIVLGNKSGKEQDYFFYDNYWNGNGTAGANFDKPLKNIKVGPNSTVFVDLPETFKGRVQRGKELPATWVEFQLSASNDKKAHGDISLQQGCDGAATISSTDGSNRTNGFTYDVLSHAPEAAVMKKPDGTKALASTVGNWMAGPNQAAIDYLNRVVGQKKAYITGGTGTDDVASSNKRLAVSFY